MALEYSVAQTKWLLYLGPSKEHNKNKTPLKRSTAVNHNGRSETEAITRTVLKYSIKMSEP